MKPKFRYSRRQIVNGVLNMLDSGIPVKRVANILARYLFVSNQTRNVELYIRDIETELVNRYGKATAHVFTARSLGPSAIKQIKSLIKDSPSIKDVEIIETIDPKLIGGIVIKTANSELDGSVQTKLQQLRSI